MSEATSRSSASRGRGSGRGGRGGFGGRGGRRANGESHQSTDDSLGAFDDDGDLSELRKQYGDKTSAIREMFPDWSEADILFALQETNGDQTEAATKIADGTISQWGEVSKAKKPTRPKAKEASTSTEQPSTARATRGGRTVSEGGRGRGRATDRGGRAPRGRSEKPGPNGARKDGELSVPTEESPAWSTEKPEVKAEPTPSAVEDVAPEPAKPAAPAVKTWASMLRQSAPPKPAPKPTPKPVEPVAPAPIEQQPAAEEEEKTPVAQNATVEPVAVIEEPALPPPRDDLTETNLEQVIDDSQPPATGTAASTAADSWDPRQSPLSSNATPLSAAQHQHQSRAPISGYAASAIKATAERTSRVPSYQRRVLDQEEAVRMPGNREVDRTAVQFGAFNLTDGDEDVDGEREDAETRAQPPADSPVSHPRASLPPVSQSIAVPDAFAQKPNAPAPPPGMAPAGQTPQTSAPNQQYGRFGAQDAAAGQKPLDPFNQQAAPASQPPFDTPATSQPPTHGAFSSAPGDYSSYYTANQPDRNPYNYYGQQQQYGQLQQGQQDGAAAQRPLGGYNATQTDNLSQYPQSGSMHSQPRFGGASDSQNSGHSTPNPTAQAQQQSQGQGQSAQGSQPQGHGQQYPGYGHYYHPYYQHNYYSTYGGQGGFGPYGGKGGMYGQPYGVSPNGPYDQVSSQGGFGGPSSLHRDNSASGGLGDYGRTGAGQTAGQPGLAGAGFGTTSHDSFQRGSGSFQSGSQSYGAQSQQGANASADDLKPFGDNKTGSGPSPSLGGARPGSAANNAAGSQGSGLPPPQGGAYGAYPNQGQGLHGSGGYGMGGAAGSSQHGNAPYGSYGQGFGGSGYYGGGQQQRGWGGNYH